MHFDDCVIYLLKKDVSIYLTDVNGLDLHCYPYLSFVPVGALEFQETLKWTLSHLQALLGLSKNEKIIEGNLFVCVKCHVFWADKYVQNHFFQVTRQDFQQKEKLGTNFFHTACLCFPKKKLKDL